VCIVIQRTLISTLFPYTTLFRSYQWWVAWLVTTNKSTGLSRAQRTHSQLYIHPCLPRLLRHTHLGLPLVCHIVLQTHPKCILGRSEEHTSELQSREKLVCRLLLE